MQRFRSDAQLRATAAPSTCSACRWCLTGSDSYRRPSLESSVAQRANLLVLSARISRQASHGHAGLH